MHTHTGTHTVVTVKNSLTQHRTVKLMSVVIEVRKGGAVQDRERM